MNITDKEMVLLRAAGLSANRFIKQALRTGKSKRKVLFWLAGEKTIDFEGIKIVENNC